MQQTVKISVLHVILLSMTVIGLKNHVTLLPPILEEGGRDGWMSVILAFLYILPFLACMYLYILTPSLQIAKPVKWFLALLVLVLCAMTLIEMLQWVRTTFLPTTPVLVLLLLYFVLCMIFSTKGIQAIVTVNVLVLAGVLFLGFMVAIINIQVKDYTLLRPFFEHGYLPVVQTSVFPASGYIELVLLLFLMPYLKTRLKFSHLLVMVILLAGLTIGPLIGGIAAFGPEEASKQRYPAFEEWGLASIGRFIDHMDFFSIYQWMTGAFIRISFYIFIVSILFNIQYEPKKMWRYIAPMLALLCLVLLLIDEQVFLYLNNYVIPIVTLIVLALFSIYVAVASWIRRKKERRADERAII